MPLWHSGVSFAARKMPKVVGPTTHAILDYAVAASFFFMAARFWRTNRRAALGSALCGGAVATNALLTDYPGGVRDVIDYKTHGRIDAGLAGLTAAVPRLMNFSDEPEARAFGLHALAETAITSMTDFDCYEEGSSQRLQHSEDVA
jgi:hypothetical protein